MMDRFSSIVAGFCNNYSLAERTLCQPFKYLSMTQLCKMFLGIKDEEEASLFEGSASVRAKLAYDIFHYLLNKPVADENGNEIDVLLNQMDRMVVTSDEGEEDGITRTAEELKASSKSGGSQSIIMNIEEALAVLAAQQDIIKRQNSLRPLFVNYFRGKIFHRLVAVECRRSLAEHGYDIDKLQDIWTEKKMVRIWKGA